MIVTKIMTAAFAHTMEEPDHDTLTRNLTPALVNLGIAELTDDENAYRFYDDTKEELTEPVTVEKPEDDVPYDYHITGILLPLWLAWKIFEGLDDDNRAMNYRSLFEQARAKYVPVVHREMTDYNDMRRECDAT